MWRRSTPEGHTLLARRFYSVGGGFVVAGSEENPDIPEVPAAFNQVVLPYRYKHMVELIAFCGRDGKTIPEIVRENERVWRTDEEIDRELDHIWSVMKEAMDRGLRTEGMLPGAYKVARRAAGMKRRLEKISLTDDPLAVLDWVCSFAFAVGEENATGRPHCDRSDERRRGCDPRGDRVLPSVCFRGGSKGYSGLPAHGRRDWHSL